MITQEKTKMIKDIDKLLALGVTKQAIADSTNMSKQAFHARLSSQRFTVDHVHLFYKKYGKIL